MCNRSRVVTKVSTAPIRFALLTIVAASLLGTIADIVFGVDEPFFSDSVYGATWRAGGDWQTMLQEHLPPLFSASIFLHSLIFAVVLMAIVFWARLLSGTKRWYWNDVVATLYLLPIVLIVTIVEYCTVNLSFRIVGDDGPLFVKISWLITMISAVIAYGIVLSVIDKAYFKSGWRRSIHFVGYAVIIPILLFVLSAAIGIVPVGIQVFRVISPTLKGDAKLDKGEFEAAEKLYLQAIKSDSREVWSSRAHIQLITVYSRQILALLPDITVDSGIRARLFHYFVHREPLQRVFKLWRPQGSINVTPTQLIEFREAMLNGYLVAGDIPVTNSELDCALRSTAVEEGCDELPKEAVANYVNTPDQRQRLYYLIYRTHALRGEPAATDARRYIQFLLEVPIRIEIMYARYRALNLARESETLAYLDDKNGIEEFDRDQIIKGNSDILKHGYKYPHVILPDAELKKLSDQEIKFIFRQTYLNYLQTEVRQLAESHISGESSIIRQNSASIEEQLSWVAKENAYRGIPSANARERVLLELLGTDREAEIKNSSKVK
ncbi:hypothetical protein GALL_100870 [mine drainage metagenome]|uniref:Uncharacterized protein n=1 Tax=mine drainage metagenome TaxID=410659 RepID=A0A1J5SUV8_9ZZZZ